jgi:hypothetical protein
VKLRGVRINARRKAFEVRTSSRWLLLPFGKVEPRPTPDDPVVRAFVDTARLGGFVFVLRSGRKGRVHVEQVLEYNRDPSHLRDQLLYALTLETQKRVKASALSRRELIRVRTVAGGARGGHAGAASGRCRRCDVRASGCLVRPAVYTRVLSCMRIDYGLGCLYEPGKGRVTTGAKRSPRADAAPR